MKSNGASRQREVFDRASGRCQCTAPAGCHTPGPRRLAGRCLKWFDYWMDGWVISDGKLFCQECHDNQEESP